MPVRETVQRWVLPQQTWASGVTAAKSFTYKIEGRIEQIEVKINNNTGDRTLTLAIASQNGATLFSQAAIAENATTRYNANSEKGTQDASYDAFLVDEICTFTVTPSGDPGTSGMTADIVLYGR